MSWGRTSELKTAPDVREKRRYAKANHSLIPVFERRRMFEETDSVEKNTGSNSRRGSRLSGGKNRDISRSSSLRSSKRFKTDDGSPLLKAKQGSFTSNTLPLWQRLRNFGHYDTQSMIIESLHSSDDGSSASTTKKPTGASAAAQEGNSSASGDVSNTLVAPCPIFKNEIGGDNDWLTEESPSNVIKGHLSHDKQRRVGSRQKLIVDGDIPLNKVVLRGPMNSQVSELLQKQSGVLYLLEFLDHGASYYRHYFLGVDHQNFFGVDENVGPVAISLKRERVPEETCDFYGIMPTSTQNHVVVPKYQWRVIVRTSQLTALRGTILEESIPTSAKMGTNKGIPPRDVVEYITQGEISASVLKQGKNERKVLNELVRLDEQELNNKYKIGVMYCKPGQNTEEDMYNNESGSPAFDEFLELLGERVKMKGFSKYRAQLDNKTDTTGEFSVYTEFRDTEVMFHVSTLLPYTESNKQQLLRKRHIGNDIVTLVFQEPGCEPFSAKCIRSHFQHIFIVVRVENPNMDFTKYRVAVSRSQDIPFFGPTIPEGAAFDKNDMFREFLLTKMINACNASLRSEKFSKMAVRTRRQYLNDLAEEGSSNLTLDQVSSGKVAGLLRNLSHRKFREKGRQDYTLLFTPGALTWNVKLLLRSGDPLPFSEEADYVLDCVLGLAADFLVLIDANTQEIVLHIPMMDVTGWIQDSTRINLFYDDSFCLSLECYDNDEDCAEICKRLYNIAPKLTLSHEATLMEFTRGPNGLLGFGINEVGVVQKVDGLARSVGLQRDSRLLQVEDRLLCCHSHKQIMEVLTDRKRLNVKAYVVPPAPTGRPVLYYPALNWMDIWSARPSNVDNEECKTQNGTQNGTTTPEPFEPVSFRKHTRAFSNSNRKSYFEAMQCGEYDEINKYSGPMEDSEPIYDRLVNKERMKSTSPPRARSPSFGPRGNKPEDIRYTRVNRKMKASRGSVVPLADQFKDRSPSEPEPMEYSVEEYSPGVQARVSSSTKISDHKSHMAAPLTEKFSGRRPNTTGQKRPKIKVSSPGVNELSKRFLYGQSSPSSKTAGSKIPVSNAPLKATASPSEMTNTPNSLPSNQTKQVNGYEVKIRNGISGGKVRPSSWDFSSKMESKENDVFITKDDSTSHLATGFESDSFHRNSNIRTAFRRKSASRELSPEPSDFSPHETSPPRGQSNLPSSPSTGRKLQAPSDSPKLSQGSNSSQGSGPPMSVRERTQKWESRGGGIPSYFTLPKSYRHKATDKTPPTIPPQGVVTSKSIPRKVSSGGDRHASGIPQPTGSRSQRGSASSDARMPPTRRISREEADGSSNPDERVEGKGRPSRQSQAKKTVTVTVSKSKRDSRESSLPTRTLGSPTTSTQSGTTQAETSQSSKTPTGLEDGEVNIQSLTLSDKSAVANGNIEYKPRVEEWVRQTSQTALPLESVTNSTPPREVASPTHTENSLSYSQMSESSQELIESLRAQVDFLQGQLEMENESKQELHDQIKTLQMQLSHQSKKRLKTVKTAMI